MTYKLTNSSSIIRIQDGASIPTAPGNVDYDNYLLWVAAGNTPTPVDVPTPAQVLATLTAVVQKHLDDFAKTRSYDSILSASSYATSVITTFAAEGKYCLSSRDTTWSQFAAIMAAVQAGTTVAPTAAVLITELPVLAWPV